MTGDFTTENTEDTAPVEETIEETVEKLQQAATQFHATGQFLSAEATYRKILSLAPNYFPAVSQFALLLEQTNRIEEAQHYYDLSLAANPDYTFAIERKNLLKLRQEATENHLAGNLVGAETFYQQILAIEADYFPAVIQLGLLLEATDRPEAALQYYEQAIALSSGHSLAFTRRAVLQLREFLNIAPPAASQSASELSNQNPNGTIAMSILGTRGRFGNQLLQYGFLRMYAAEHQLDFRVVDWIGRYLFDLNDPIAPTQLPILFEQPIDLPLLFEEAVDFEASLNRTIDQVYTNVDVIGFFNFVHQQARYRELFQSLFQPGKAVQAVTGRIDEILAQQGQELVAIHIRRTDFVSEGYWLPPLRLYLNWLDRVWPQLHNPVLYIATDDPKTIDRFEKFNPISAEIFQLQLPGAEFYIDWYVLTQANLLLLGNGTFSLSAALTNRKLTLSFRPDKATNQLVPFVPWQDYFPIAHAKFYEPPVSCQISVLNQIYEQFFGRKSDGVFMEIGAFDGETCSNTSFLADLGWQGYYIEPVPEYAALCAERHRGNLVTVVQVAVGDRDTTAEISVAGVLSSMAPHHIEAFRHTAWGQHHHEGDLREVEQVTPDTLLDRLQLTHLDLLVIDVEGFEWTIIEHWDFLRCYPRMIIVESRDLSPEFGETIQQESLNVIQTLEFCGYEIFWGDECNIVFVATEESETSH